MKDVAIIIVDKIKKLIALLLYQPPGDFAGISLTPHELSPPPSAVSAAAERQGDKTGRDLDTVEFWSLSVHLSL